MLEAHVAIDLPPFWRSLTDRYDAKVTVLDWLREEGSCCKVLLRIEVEPWRADGLVAELRACPAIGEVDLTTGLPGNLKGIVATDDCLGCCASQGAGVFQLEGRMLPDGQLEQVFVVKDREALRAVVSSMEAHGHRVTLLKLTPLHIDEVLTSRQESILAAALEGGYFDQPRGISLRDLATAFGVSIATVSEMLRKATFKVMDTYFHQAH